MKSTDAELHQEGNKGAGKDCEDSAKWHELRWSSWNRWRIEIRKWLIRKKRKGEEKRGEKG